jgi:hypothetical protein
LVFPGVLEEVVLLLAEGCGSSESFEVFQVRNLSELSDASKFAWTGFSPQGEQKWTSALLPSDAFSLYEQAIAGSSFELLRDWGDVYLGAVTGNNRFFTLSREQVSALQIPSTDLLRISPPGSRHLRALSFSDPAWEKLAESGSACFLLHPKKSPSRAASTYIESGEKLGVHAGYKCQNRDPWWRVPLVERPDLLLTYMNQDRPRLVRNDAGVQVLNSLYGVRLRVGRATLGKDLLPLAALNSLSLLGAEIVGRAYGGGMLKHEPREADLLPMPSKELLKKCQARLTLLRHQISGLLRGTDSSKATEIVDNVILVDGMGLTQVQLASIRSARDSLLQRRIARSRGHGSDR